MNEGVGRYSGSSSPAPNSPAAPSSFASALLSSPRSPRSPRSHFDTTLPVSPSAGASLPTSLVERKSGTDWLHCIPGAWIGLFVSSWQVLGLLVPREADANREKVYNARTYARKSTVPQGFLHDSFLVRIFSARNTEGRSNVGRRELKSNRQLTGRRISLYGAVAHSSFLLHATTSRPVVCQLAARHSLAHRSPLTTSSAHPLPRALPVLSQWRCRG